MGRKRVIYQSEALFTKPANLHSSVGEADQLLRVQDISHGVELNRQDVNEFGQLEAVERKIIEPPTVSLDFSYYLHGGRNERLMDFALTTVRSGAVTTGLQNSIKNFLSGDSGQNYYIGVSAEGADAKDGVDTGVIGIGNGYITSYSVEAAVGDMPSASVSIEASNLEFSTAVDAVPNPALNTETGERLNADTLDFPNAADTGKTGDNDTATEYNDWEYGCLRPGDVIIDFNDAGYVGPATSGSLSGDGDIAELGGAKLEGDGQCHIQNFTLDVPLSREALTRLGSVHPYSREVETPINITLSVSAFLGDITEGNLNDILCDTSTRNIRIKMLEPCPDPADGRRVAQEFLLKKASLDSQNFSASIGDNKTVDLVFSAQAGGADSVDSGLFMWGATDDDENGEGTSVSDNFVFSETEGQENTDK